MKHVTLMDLIETDSSKLLSRFLEIVSEQSWYKDDLQYLYSDIQNKLDHIYIVPIPDPYMDIEYPEVYLLEFKDGAKLLLDAEWPMEEKSYIEVDKMKTIDRDLKGADFNHSDYEMFIPKGSLLGVIEMGDEQEIDILVALSPDLKQGIATPGSGHDTVIGSRVADIFETDDDYNCFFKKEFPEYKNYDFAFVADYEGDELSGPGRFEDYDEYYSDCDKYNDDGTKIKDDDSEENDDNDDDNE